jgi:uncharacterized protein (DUF4415 family)
MFAPAKLLVGPHRMVRPNHWDRSRRSRWLRTTNMKKQKKSNTVVHDLKPDRPMSARQKREIQALANMPEGKIDTSEIPELPPGAWKNAVRGKWYRPVKQAVSIRLDADVLAWLKAKGDGYQTRVNVLLRERMLEEISK